MSPKQLKHVHSERPKRILHLSEMRSELCPSKKKPPAAGGRQEDWVMNRTRCLEFVAQGKLNLSDRAGDTEIVLGGSKIGVSDPAVQSVKYVPIESVRDVHFEYD